MEALIRTALRPSAALTALAAALALALVISAGAAPAAQAGSGCPDAATPSTQLSQGEARQAVRCLINEERARRNLRLHRKLNRPAAKHSRTMRDQNCLRHVCPGEPTLQRRLRKYLRGARRTRFSEVIASYPASRSPRDIVDRWMDSAPHRELILGRFKHMGVGVAIGDGLAWYTVTLGWKR